jgi:hypothetical protein
MSISETSALFRAWYDLPQDERNPPTQRAFAEEHGITEQTLVAWKRKIEEDKSSTVDGIHDTKMYLTMRSRELDEALVKAVKDGKPEAMKIAQLLMGRLGKKEKEENNFEPTAERVSELIRLAEEEIRAGDNGNRKMPKEPEVFFNELCLHSQPEHRQEN